MYLFSSNHSQSPIMNEPTFRQNYNRTMCLKATVEILDLAQ